MGIPRFYRWISERYPLLNQTISDVSLLPEFDNLYLDMNGILHQCTHPNDADLSASVSEKDQILGIFTYIDRIVTHIIKPNKVLFLAVDGVAPRAKLNQQRSRRFRSGLELLQKKQQMAAETLQDDDAKYSNEREELFDSNCITPGTEFMARVDKHLKYFIRKKVKEDPLWRKLTIIYSGHDVPGEGEHKIMDFIRGIKSQPGYRPNVRHCMYGSDADLMLLGLATHEPHFTLVREVVVWGSNSKGKKGADVVLKQIKEQEWQLVHLSLFREYLDFELRVDVPFYDMERALDDFIFMTFFLGNDFIPHSPTLEIGEDAIALLLNLYRELLPTWGGFLTDSGHLTDPTRLESMFTRIGQMEEDILVKRAKELKKFERRKRGYVREEVEEAEDDEVEEEKAEMDFETALLEAIEGEEHAVHDKWLEEDEEAAEETELIVLEGSESFQETKLNYYKKKFGISVDQPSLLDQVRLSYAEALLWCLHYYYQGPASWTWFYPFHYSPMLSDLTNLGPFLSSVKFSIGKPLQPFSQLLSCLPASSSALLPSCYRSLMTQSTSPILEYYPMDFEIDMEGKRNPWEGVNLLPFIDGQRLNAAVNEYCPESKLTENEKARNRLGKPIIVRYDSSVITNIQSSYPEFGLPDILACNSSMLIFEIPPSPTGKFKPVLVPGVRIPLAGFPSLRTLHISTLSLQSAQLNCFGMKSRKETLMLHVDGDKSLLDITQGDFHESASTLVGQQVFVSWPNLHEARVVAISSAEGEYRSDETSATPHADYRAYTEAESKDWSRAAADERRKYYAGRGVPGSGGVFMEDLKLLIHVVVLQGMIRDLKSGAVRKKFGTEEAILPERLTLRHSPAIDPRFEETPPPPFASRFPLESQVVIIDGEHKGYLATVLGHEKGSLLSLKFNALSPEPPFGRVIAQQIRDRYYPGGLVSKRLGISPSVLGRIVGGVSINPGRCNIGLNIKVKKQYMLLGYTRLQLKSDDGSDPLQDVWQGGNAVKIIGSENHSSVEDDGTDAAGFWEYSEKTLHLVATYKRKFPLVFESLETLPFSGVYDLKVFFGKAEDPKKMLEDCLLWLEQLETNKLPLSPVLTRAMSPHAISAVEQAANVRQEMAVDGSATPTEVRGIRPEQVFRPNSTINHELPPSENDRNKKRGTFSGQAPQLGDRVVNLTARSVPFGLRGTVVVVHPDSGCVEVLFDGGFVGGTTLGGMCSNYRGKLVPWASLLSLEKPRKGQQRSRTPQKGKSATPTKERRPKTPSNRGEAKSTKGTSGKAAAPPRILQKQPVVSGGGACEEIPPPPVPPSDKMSELFNKWKEQEKRGELDNPQATTSGTSMYYQQLQQEALLNPRKPASQQPPQVTSAQQPAKSSEQQEFMNLLNKAFGDAKIQAPPLPPNPPMPPAHNYPKPQSLPKPSATSNKSNWKQPNKKPQYRKKQPERKVPSASSAAPSSVKKGASGLLMPSQVMKRQSPSTKPKE